MNALLDTCVEDAVAITSNVFGVPALEIRGKRRPQTTCDARHTVWSILRRNGWKLQQIGRVFNTDSSTVLNGLRRVKSLSDVDPKMRARVAESMMRYGFPTKAEELFPKRDLEPKHIAKPKRQKLPLCDCSLPGKIKTGGSWVCVRCSQTDGQRWASDSPPNPDAKYHRVFSYTLPQGSALN